MEKYSQDLYQIIKHFSQLMITEILKTTKDYKPIGIRVNGQSVHEITQGLSFGCNGVGLCRTEHMFFEKRAPTNFTKSYIKQLNMKKHWLNSIISKNMI